jgi:hypothetical protein
MESISISASGVIGVDLQNGLSDTRIRLVSFITSIYVAGVGKS